MSRFQEALSHFSTLFEALDASMPAEHPDRVLLEQEFFGRDILNIVACEGLERVERAETYRQWQARTLRAGFTQMPIMKTTVEKISNLMRGFHRNYGIGEDGGWLLAGWKETILQAFSTWQPTPISPWYMGLLIGLALCLTTSFSLYHNMSLMKILSVLLKWQGWLDLV